MADTTISLAVRVELDRLVGLYGDDVNEVGAVDGTEDDWGDLLGELATLVGIDCEDGRSWDRFQAAADEQVEAGRTIEQIYLALVPLGQPREDTVAERNLAHVIAGGCDDPDCELHHPEVAVEEGTASKTAQAWFLAGAFAVVREFQTQYDIQDDALVAITVALRNVEATQIKE